MRHAQACAASFSGSPARLLMIRKSWMRAGKGILTDAGCWRAVQPCGRSGGRALSKRQLSADRGVGRTGLAQWQGPRALDSGARFAL